MNPSEVECPRCSKITLRKNLPRHLKTCGLKKPATREPQRPCQTCGVHITLSNRARHLKKCNPSLLKRKADEPEPSTSKKTRLVDEPQPSTSTRTSIVESMRSSIVRTYNSIKNTIGDIVGKLRIKEVETAFKGRMKTYSIVNRPNIKDPAGFLQQARELIRRKIEENLKEKNIKVNLVFLVEYKKPISDKEESKEMNFKSKNTVILPTTDILEYIKDSENKLLTEMDEFYAKGSGWSLSKILSLKLAINRYVPLRGSTYIELPKKITSKKAVLNIQNNDQKCFLWSVLAALHPVSREDNPHQVQHYLPYEHELDQYLQRIEFPVSLDQVKLFEKRSGISVNVYAYDEKFVVYPLLVADRIQQRHVDLLYMKQAANSHYCLVRDLSRLTRNQLTKHHGQSWVCRRCLQHYIREDLLASHMEYCHDQEAVKIEMPKQGSKIKFVEGNRAMRLPFTGYADFECMLIPIDERVEQGDETKSYTKQYQKHEAVSFCYYIVYADAYYGEPVKYFGRDAPRVFVDSLFRESKKIAHLYSAAAAKPMEITPEDLITITNSEICHICEKPFTDPEDYKVRDHDHLTGKFRGIAHNLCNLKFRKPNFIPIFIHNLSGYDTHLFIKMFGVNDETISVIPNHEERYISYTIEIEGGVKLRFLDSCRFMMSSLDSLARNLSPAQFRETSRFYSGEQLQLLVKKGVYPYDFMDSLEKYRLTTLPEKADFYNRLNEADITDEEHEHAQKVWTAFKLQNMEEYTILYNQTDVLLLADIMENFRDVCMNTYKLDPAWYYTAPGLAWGAMLKTTRIELDLLVDNEMRLVIARGIRGGISQCSNRYVKANNPYMAEYDENKPITYLTYLDANNLYGWAMSQPMPYADFQWVHDPKNVDFMNIQDDGPRGYIFEVDLDYPRELHDSHSDYPLAPEQRIPPGSKSRKLLLTLFNKRKYVLHYRNLKLYISLGMRVKKIHRAISFMQSTCLKSYIDLNTDMRTRATTDFEKDFYKLMNNSVFGKTMENILNRVDIRLATKDEQDDKWLAQPNFKSRTIFTEHLAAVHLSKTRLMFNKAIYVGMSILDVSKLLMYNFHYDVIKKRYGDKAQLHYTNTDSLTYFIETEDWYKDMKEMIELFDTSDYSDPNRYNLPRANKKVLGKMKDELSGHIMFEHVALRSKMYATRSEQGESKKAKGIKKSVVKKDLMFSDYKECLDNFSRMYSTLDTPFNTVSEANKKYKACEVMRTMNLIRSRRHNLYSVELNKIALSALDDNRYIQEEASRLFPGATTPSTRKPWWIR